MRRLLCLIALFAVAATPAGAATRPNEESYFIGTWECMRPATAAQPAGPATRWVFKPIYNGNWLQVDWGAPDGTAMFGWVPGMNRYVYDDFHGDGSFAHVSSEGPKSGVWTFSSDYYPPDGPVMRGARITYTTHGAGRYDRLFEIPQADGTFQRVGADTCTKKS